MHKTTSTDDKRLQSTLKRLGVNTIPGIEEVLLINNDGSALQFNNPKVQASIAANTYVVSGASQPKREWRSRLLQCCCRGVGCAWQQRSVCEMLEGGTPMWVWRAAQVWVARMAGGQL